MALTGTASFLNTFFGPYDELILGLLHSLKNPVFTFLFKLITLIGEKGLIFFLAALVFMCFRKTRKFGVCLFGAVACGALFTNVILKDLVARPRPFDGSDVYRSWWEAVGSPFEDGFSFPSGHVTAAAAGMSAITLMKGKKWIGPSVIWVVVMMLARNYLMAHYPSDVLVGAILGVASGFIAYAITGWIFDFLRKNRKKAWADFALNFDLPIDKINIKFLEPVISRISPLLIDEDAPRPGINSLRKKSSPADDADEDIDEYFDDDPSPKHSFSSPDGRQSLKFDPKELMNKLPDFKRDGKPEGKYESKHELKSADKKSFVSSPKGYQGKHLKK